MTYDTGLERRIDATISDWGSILQKKKMFGAIGYLVNGNMAFGIHKDELIVRTDEAKGDELLKEPGVRHFSMGSHTSMKNWYMAGGEAIADDFKLAKLLELGNNFAQSLPPKKIAKKL